MSWKNMTLYYYNKDHLGNNREVVNENGTIEQVTNYYPFGAPYCDNTNNNADLQPYKYNGKELDLTHGLNTYDYGARQYNSIVPSWTSVDPFAEKYYNISPYVYCMDNPIYLKDLDGKWGVQTIDRNAKIIRIDANIYCASGEQSYIDVNLGTANTLKQYTQNDVDKMNKYAERYKNAGMVSDGEYKGYMLQVNLTYKLGGNAMECQQTAENDCVDGARIGNSMEKQSANINPYFKEKENNDGTTSTVGGVTIKEEGKIVMNASEDSHVNEAHEAFHLLGFSHPKGKGGNGGIMNYPPQKLNQNDINDLSKPSEYLHTIIVP